MIKRRFLPLVLLSLLMTNVQNSLSVRLFAEEPSLKQRTDQIVQPYLDNSIFVGTTIGVLRDGKQEVFGYGRLSQDDPKVPDGETIYEFGSATKVLTGLLLADAVVQGRVRLDQPAGELLPTGVKMPSQGERAITLQDLSTHMSGLPRIPGNLKPTNLSNPYADYTVDDLYSFLNSYKLTRPPGEKSEYSNLGAGLLGHLLALQANSTYEKLLVDRIATPLKMSSTRIALDERMRAKLAPGHTEGGKQTANWDMPVLAGAGAVRSSVNDVLRFAVANLSPPKDKFGDAIELAWQIHQQPLTAGDSPMGLGWHVIVDGTHWHNGGTGGYHSMILINRQYKTCAVLMTNTATSEVEQLAIDLLKMISGAKVEPRRFEKKIKVPTESRQKFVGSYEFSPGLEMTITTEDGKLMAMLTGQGANEIFPRSETVWFYKGVDATITFNIDKSGKCISLELLQNGIKQTAKRIKDPIKVPPETLQKYVGQYQLAPGAEFTVTAEDDKLMVSLTGQPTLRVFARSETVWFPKEMDATITFKVDKSGECNSLELFQLGKKTIAKRIKKSVKAPAKNLQKLVGTYELIPGIEFDVGAADENLMVSLTGQPSIEITSRSETVWFYKVIDATVTFTFNVDKGGECNSLELLQNGKKQTAKRIKNTIKVPAEDLQKFAGRYELAPGSEFEVTAEGEKLMASLTGQSTFEIFPRSETVWFYKAVEATITFNFDKSGHCNSLELSQLGKKKTAKRIK
jgi:CubicO group peptidase (beta-lactamase class C family)